MAGGFRSGWRSLPVYATAEPQQTAPRPRARAVLRDLFEANGGLLPLKQGLRLPACWLCCLPAQSAGRQERAKSMPAANSACMQFSFLPCVNFASNLLCSRPSVWAGAGVYVSAYDTHLVRRAQHSLA